MKFEKTLLDKSYLFFIAFFFFMLAGFWVTYFTRILDQQNYRMHTHGAALILWCLLLISQAWLIRAKKYAWHRQLGVFSYVLVPVMIFTTLDLLKYRLPAELTGPDYFFIALVINALIAFVILYSLAIYFRKQPLIHARFMICTLFPMVTPITDRILHIHFPVVLKYVPVIGGYPKVEVVGFALADLVLIALCIWDWRSHKKAFVFPIALGVLLLYHLSVVTFFRFEFWQTFCHWFHEV